YDWAYQDYLWLPTASESSNGLAGAAMYTTGVWGIEPGDSVLSSKSRIWCRGAHSYYPGYGTAMETNGDETGNNDLPVTKSYSIRPALHLNLTKANDCLVRECETPIDVSVDYNAEEWSIDEDHFENLPSWYNSEKMELSYTSGGNYIDADSNGYTVRVDLKQDFINKFGVFKDGSTSKEIKLIVKPRILTPTKWEWNSTTNQPDYAFEANSIYQRDIDNDTEPEFGFTFTSGDGTVYNTWPTVKGTYKIALRITNPTVCTNYALASTIALLEQTIKLKVNFDSATDTINWYVNTAPLTVNSLPYVPIGYNITVGGYLGTGSTLASRGLKLGGIYLQNSPTTAQSLGIKDVKSYTIIAHLVNASEDYYAFSYDFTYSLTITKAKYDLSGVTWAYDHDTCTYNGSPHTVTLKGLEQYNGLLEVDRYTGNSESTVGATDYTATVARFKSNDSNYETPVSTDPNSYIYD
ncbi:MAG: hypothetical protein K2N18_04675, partial [Clostridia bacterium]|nr:hypothetical protein [Clostridia bacterium]